MAGIYTFLLVFTSMLLHTPCILLHMDFFSLGGNLLTPSFKRWEFNCLGLTQDQTTPHQPYTLASVFPHPPTAIKIFRLINSADLHYYDYYLELSYSKAVIVFSSPLWVRIINASIVFPSCFFFFFFFYIPQLWQNYRTSVIGVK